MNTRHSLVNAQWWDFTSLDQDLLDRCASLSLEDLQGLNREHCEVRIYNSLDDMFLSQALEYLTCWQQATADNPAGICGPVGPVKQMPIVAKLVNELNIDLRHCHFWGMDEWCVNGQAVSPDHPLSFTGANHRLWYNQIKPELRMPEHQLHFPTHDNLASFSQSFADFRCLKMQGGLGHTLHWAFNDPLPCAGEYADAPPTAEQYQALPARFVQLHPISQIQNATGLTGRDLTRVPDEAVTVGPKETFLCDEVSIWYPGHNQNPFGLRLAVLMVAEKIKSSLAPISVLADHPKVTFHIYGPSITSCEGSISA